MNCLMKMMESEGIMIFLAMFGNLCIGFLIGAFVGYVQSKEETRAKRISKKLISQEQFNKMIDSLLEEEYE